MKIRLRLPLGAILYTSRTAPLKFTIVDRKRVFHDFLKKKKSTWLLSFSVCMWRGLGIGEAVTKERPLGDAGVWRHRRSVFWYSLAFVFVF